MNLDLFKSYKRFYQRWYIRKHSKIRADMKDVAHDIIKYLYDNRFSNNKNLVKERALEIAEVLLQLEVRARFENLVATEIIEAIQSGQYVIEVPYPVARRWDTEYMTGHVYVMTSKNMMGCAKLGATMMDLSTRISKYRNRYGYEVELFFSKEFLGPFTAEKKIGELIIDNRLSAKDEAHTNEWYEIQPKLLKKIIENYQP
jgi:hypothetical protein